MSEKENKWGPWLSSETSSKHMQSDQPYRVQQANRREGKWSKWASEVRQSQPGSWDYSSDNGARLPATIVPGSIKIVNLQSGRDQSGLLQLQGI